MFTTTNICLMVIIALLLSIAIRVYPLENIYCILKDIREHVIDIRGILISIGEKVQVIDETLGTLSNRLVETNELLRNIPSEKLITDIYSNIESIDFSLGKLQDIKELLNDISDNTQKGFNGDIEEV